MKILGPSMLFLLFSVTAVCGVMLFSGRPSVNLADRVDIYALDGGATPMTVGAPNSFPLWPYSLDEHHRHHSGARILGWRSLTGADAVLIKTLWENLRFDDSMGAMCHMPAYGLRFYQGGRELFETSVCWACNNYYSPSVISGFSWRGFDGNAISGKILLNELRRFLANPWVDEHDRERIQDG